MTRDDYQPPPLNVCSDAGAHDVHPCVTELQNSGPSVTRLPVVRDTGIDNVVQRLATAHVLPTAEGCPSCDDYPDFPARHCGRPSCRDAQAIAWAQQTGRDPAAVLEALDAPEPLAGGLCGACVHGGACTVGMAVLAAGDDLAPSVAGCKGYAPG